MTSFLFGFVLDFIQNICRFNSIKVSLDILHLLRFIFITFGLLDS